MSAATKICRKCGVEKALSEYSKHTSTKDGFRNECKSCTVAGVRRWRELNPDKVQANVDKHRDKRRADAKKWREANPDKVQAQRERAKLRRQEKRNG